MNTNFSAMLLTPALVFGVLTPAASAQTGNLANPAALKEAAPPVYKVRFDTSKGPFVVEVHRDWAPNGADRFYNLVKNGFYDDTRFFRVISGFMVQFGINGDPKISAPWRAATINDDPVKQSNKRGYITFAFRPEFSYQPGLHQFRRQRRARPSGLLAVWPSRLRDERGGCAVQRLRRRGSVGSGTGARPNPAGRERLSQEGLSQSGLHQESHHRKVGSYKGPADDEH